MMSSSCGETGATRMTDAMFTASCDALGSPCRRDRPQQGPHCQGERRAQLRQPASRGVSQGDARHAAGRQVRSAYRDDARHCGRIPGSRGRGARSGVGHRRVPRRALDECGFPSSWWASARAARAVRLRSVSVTASSCSRTPTTPWRVPKGARRSSTRMQAARWRPPIASASRRTSSWNSASSMRSIPEPLGGAHHDPVHIYEAVRERVGSALDALVRTDPDQLVADRYERLRDIGVTASDAEYAVTGAEEASPESEGSGADG